MAIKNYLDYTGLKKVLKRLLPGVRKIWHGTAEEWHNLSDEERNKYDQAEVIDKVVNGADLATAYIRKQNILSNYERITSRKFTAAYDGEIDGYTKGSVDGELRITINDVVISLAKRDSYYSLGTSVHATVKKGDRVEIWDAKYTDYYFVYARWYKQRDYTGR